jgi:hypothetical protein
VSSASLAEGFALAAGFSPLGVTTTTIIIELKDYED